MMSRKSSRLQESLFKPKKKNPTKKKTTKDLPTLPAEDAVGSTSSTRRSRAKERAVGGGKVGGSLKSNVEAQGSQGSQVSQGSQGSRGSHGSGKPAFRLCSSRSFSSLHRRSVGVAPLMRSCRSLNRLDQRSTARDSEDAASHVKILESELPSSSQEEIRDNKEQIRGPESEKMMKKMKTSSSSEPVSSSSSTASYQRCSNGKEQNKDGGYSLMKHSWVQTVLKNVRPGLTADVSGSRLDQKTNHVSHHEDSAEDVMNREDKTSEGTEESMELKNHLPNFSEPALTLQHLQKLNRDVRRNQEEEEEKEKEEETREKELQKRVALLAQQAQLLVTGDATEVLLDQDLQRFVEEQTQWERRVSSLKSQLISSEEQRKEAELRLAQKQQELESFHHLQAEAQQLHQHLHELKSQLHANEEAQVEKEAALQKHLELLQASQDRERRSLADRLEQAEHRAQDLQERLDQAEEDVENLSKTQIWTRDIEEAQEQLQEELSRTVSAVQKLQEEREQLDQRCRELQNQLSEADGEVSQLHRRLKSDETHYYNLEHSYERVCEELQVAAGKLEQREVETQEIREGYERLLDRKEEELSEVLLKMEVLGNSLEETEVKLNQVLEDGASSQVKPQQKANHLSPDEQNQLFHNSTSDGVQLDLRPRSGSTVEDEPEKFMCVIQLLESKLLETEEKLKDITERLEDHQSPIIQQDPHIYSQLTQCRATAQHLSLLLHTQVKQSQRFAQETENRCRTLVGRFHVALNIIHACRERLRTAPLNAPVNTAIFEQQLMDAATCLQHGERYAEEQQQESHNARKEEEKLLRDERLAGVDVGRRHLNTVPPDNAQVSVRKQLMRELFMVEKMLLVLQSERGRVQVSSAAQGDGADVAEKYRTLMCQRRSLLTEPEPDTNRPLERAIGRVCTDAELSYALFKCQQQHEIQTQGQDQHLEPQEIHIHPPELALYEEPLEVRAGENQPSEEEPEWLQRLVSRLQRRAKFLKQLFQEISEEPSSDHGDNDPDMDVDWMQEQVKWIYLSERLGLDLVEEQQQREMLQTSSRRDQQVLLHLQEDNSSLRGELELAEHKISAVEIGNQRLLGNMQKIQDFHEERMQKLEVTFQDKIEELQKIHEEEMKHLHGYYSSTGLGQKVSDQTGLNPKRESDLQHKPQHQVDAVSIVEESQRKLISDLKQQHLTEVTALLKEKDLLLREETTATLTAMAAMRRSHKQELEKSRHFQKIRDNDDVSQLHTEYEKEIQMLQKELEVLSVQHTQKCVENSELNRALQTERNLLMRIQKENQDFRKNQDQASPQEKIQTQQVHNQDHMRRHGNNNKPSDSVKFATWSPDRTGQNFKDSRTSPSTGTFPKKREKSSLRGVRSKVENAVTSLRRFSIQK